MFFRPFSPFSFCYLRCYLLGSFSNDLPVSFSVTGARAEAGFGGHGSWLVARLQIGKADGVFYHPGS